MRIDLQFGGIAAGVSGLGQIASGLEHVDRVYRSVRGSLRQLGGLSASVKFPTPTDADTRRITEYAQAWREVAKAQQGVSASAPKTSRPVAAAPSVAASAPKTAVAAHTTAAKAPSSVSSSAPATRFIRGPEQRLAEIAAQRHALPSITDPKQRARIEADLARAEFLARRSIKLHERRMVNPAESLNRPGLLELFSELNSLVKHLATGNVVGVVKDLALGIKLVSDVGGLNVAQKVARSFTGVGAGLTGTGGSASGFNPNARGVFSLSQIQAGHAQIAKGAATSPGSLSQFVLPGSTSAKIGNSPLLSGAVNAFSGIGRAVGQAVPAIGKVATSAGPLGAAFVGLGVATGGLILVVGAVALGMHLFSEGLKHTVQALTTFRDAMLMSGGSGQDVSRLISVGLDPKSIAGLSASFRDRTAIGGGDIFAQMERSRLGLDVVAQRQFGPADEVGDLIKAIEGLRRLDPTQRLQTARLTGTEGLLGAASVSPGVWRQMQLDARATQPLPGAPQAATDLQEQGGRLFRNLGAMVTQWFTPVITPLSTAVGMLADGARSAVRWVGMMSIVPAALGRLAASVWKFWGRLFEIAGRVMGLDVGANTLESVLNGVASSIDWLTGVMGQLTDGVAATVGGIARSVKWIVGLGSTLTGGGALANPISAFADKIINDMDKLSRDSAIRENTQELKKLNSQLTRPGTFGGGPRANAALGPSGVTGSMRQKAIEAHAIALGYWNL